MLVEIYKIPIGLSLSVVGGILLLSVLASWTWPRRAENIPVPHGGDRSTNSQEDLIA